MTENTILLVDDEPAVLKSLSMMLSEKYSVLPCRSAKQALEVFRPEEITVVISDIRMPKMTGIDLAEKIQSMSNEVPVILMTAYAEIDSIVSAVGKHVFDLLIKPFEPSVLMDSVARAVRNRKDAEIEKQLNIMLHTEVVEKSAMLVEANEKMKDLSLEAVQVLSSAAECRDSDTGKHIVRIGHYAHNVSVELGLGDDFISDIPTAGQMHDIGKIGIPDNILLKPGPLTKEEFEIMKTHTTIGDRILSSAKTRLLKMAGSIALNHHERWDGSGYPQGLIKEDIPIEGRIVFICDQYDALRSKRSYKGPFTHEDAMSIILKGDGRTVPAHFDPDILGIFRRTEHLFKMIHDYYQ